MTDLNDLLKAGITAVKAGHREKGKALLQEVVRHRPNDITAWLWMSGAVETDAERRECLERVLQADPENEIAKKGLIKLSPENSTSKPSQPTPSGVSVKVLEFLVPWAKPCRKLNHVLTELQREYNIEVVRIDVDQNPGLVDRFGVTSVPTLVFLRGDQISDYIVGLLSKAELKRRFDKLLSNSPKPLNTRSDAVGGYDQTVQQLRHVIQQESAKFGRPSLAESLSVNGKEGKHYFPMGRYKHLALAIGDLIVIGLVILGFAIEQDNDSSIVTVAAVVMLGYGIVVARKMRYKQKIKQFDDLLFLLLALAVYGTVGPILHFFYSLFKFFTYEEKITR